MTTKTQTRTDANLAAVVEQASTALQQRLTLGEQVGDQRIMRLLRNARLAPMLCAHPDVATLVGALHRCTPPAPTTAGGPWTDDLRAELVASLLAGNDKPDDLPARIAAARAQLDATNAEREIVLGARDDIGVQLGLAVNDRLDDALETLNGQLQAAVTTLSGIDDLEQVTDPAAALANGREDEHLQALAGMAEHRTVRSAQSAVRVALGSDEPTVVEAQYLRNVESVFPDWAAWRRYGYLEDAADQRRHKVLTAPWPIDPSQHRLNLRSNEGGAGGDSFLLWAIGAGADLWVPTRAQLAAETTRLTALLTSEFQIRAGVQDVPAPVERWIEPPSRRKMGAIR